MPKTLLFSVVITLVFVPTQRAAGDAPNILLIAVDDLNDWVGCLDGHPGPHTPNIDRLAARGMLFTNAHCQSPVCNPSRASMMTSLYPETTGIYFLNPELSASPIAKKATLLTRRFEQEGYHVTGAGKLYHGRDEEYMAHHAGSFGGFGPMPEKRISPFPDHRLWDWGVSQVGDAQMPDAKIAAWAAGQLEQQHDKPFFLATGFYRPHVPQIVPQKWFDLHPINAVQLPKTTLNDLRDISPYATNLTRLEHVSPMHDWVIDNDQWRPLVQSYLASASFVDAQIGKVIAALDASPHRDDTYIVLYSDHGFHLGEKERWAKRSLWEDGTRVPLIIVGPGIAGGKRCDQPVQLLDIYPTLLAICSFEPDDKLEGHSLLPLLKAPRSPWAYVARTSFGPGNVAIRSRRYRYIHYNDGSEEFYDHTDDPHEWTNLIHDQQLVEVIDEHRSHLPVKSHSVLGGGSTGHKAYAATEAVRD